MGGHSAAVFLSAAGRRAKMVSLDLAEFEYSETAQQRRGPLPDQLRLIAGRSEATVPRFSSATAARVICLAWMVTTPTKGRLGTFRTPSARRGPAGRWADDMQNPGPRRAFEESVRRGWPGEPWVS